MLESSKLLQLLIKRQKLLWYHDKCRSTECTFDFEWPTIEEFTVDLMIERIKQFISRRWCSSNDISIEVSCTARCALKEDQLFHFRGILTKPHQHSDCDKQRIASSTHCFQTAIYFLVELSASLATVCEVKVSYRVVNSEDSTMSSMAPLQQIRLRWVNSKLIYANELH